MSVLPTWSVPWRHVRGQTRGVATEDMKRRRPAVASRSWSAELPGSPEPPPPVRVADRPLHGRFADRPLPGRSTDERLRRWLLIRGRGQAPLDAEVRVEQIRRHSSSKRPSVQRGDEAILYAAVWQAVFGVVDVVGDPENDPERERWSWTFPIRPVSVIADLHDAPPVEAAGIFPQSLWRHSHIRLTDEQFERARTLITAVSTPR